jgi:hypothetical protein
VSAALNPSDTTTAVMNLRRELRQSRYRKGGSPVDLIHRVEITIHHSMHLTQKAPSRTGASEAQLKRRVLIQQSAIQNLRLSADSHELEKSARLGI